MSIVLLLDSKAAGTDSESAMSIGHFLTKVAADLMVLL
tara:strand:- start:2529 stop:2642 length:114 start_codon:yes stop_codon:yes gene_type:complete